MTGTENPRVGSSILSLATRLKYQKGTIWVHSSAGGVHIATIIKTKAGTWKALIRKSGSPNVSKTFRVKRDAQDWARTTEDEIVRDIYIPRSSSEKLTVAAALDRYVKEVVPTKKSSGHRRDIGRAEFLKSKMGQYSLAALW